MVKRLYSVDLRLTATAYIKADSPGEALKIARSFAENSLDLQPDEHAGIPISGRAFNDPELPDISLSPAMTIYGPYPDEVPEECE